MRAHAFSERMSAVARGSERIVFGVIDENRYALSSSSDANRLPGFSLGYQLRELVFRVGN